MKKSVISFSFIALLILTTATSLNSEKFAKICIKTAVAEENSSQNSEKLSDEDWKIELNDDTKKGSKEFGFIQKNLASSSLADNGHFLLIAGIILIVISVSGIIFFSFCLHKLHKNTKKLSKRSKGKGSRYK